MIYSTLRIGVLLGHAWAGQLVAVLPQRPRRADGEAMLVWLAAAALAITAICVSAYVAHRFLQRRRGYSHSLLFVDLCRLHGLDRASRQLLLSIARQGKLAQPAQLFVDRQWLDPARMPSRRAELAALQVRLFGEASAEASPAG